MRVRFLIDEHINPIVAEILTKKGIDSQAVIGSPLEAGSDADLLGAAAESSRIFVTYDTATVPAVFSELFRAGAVLPPGLVFVDGSTIPSDQYGALANALEKLARRIEAGKVDPSGGVFLRRKVRFTPRWPRKSWVGSGPKSSG